jgi:site-specific recombinase XerD
VPANARILAARTLRFYAHDWARFVPWCRGAGVSPLPASADTLAAYVTHLSARLSPGAIARRLSAIADQHQKTGIVAPTTDPAVKAVLKAMRRNAVRRREAPPTPAALARMIAACPGDLAGLRDGALLHLAAATRLGRAALVSLQAENIRKTASGYDLVIDVGDTRRKIALLRAPDLGKCPVAALEEWLRLSHTGFGPVFRKIDRWGNIEHFGLGTDAVRRILARRSPSRSRRVSSRSAAAEMTDPA